MEPHAAPTMSTAALEAGRRARVRRNLAVLALLAAAFYFGFIVLAVVRGSR